jgi:hypothetical protein
MFLWSIFLTSFPIPTANDAFSMVAVGQAASMSLVMACLVPHNVYDDTVNKATHGAVAGLFLFLVAFGW